MEKPKTLTLDLETETLDPYHNRILLIGYRYDSMGPVNVIRVCDGEEPDERFCESLRSPDVTKRGHNVHFDLLCLAAKGFDIDGPVDDTRILAYLQDPQQNLDLKGLVERKLHRSVVRMEDFGRNRIKKFRRLGKVGHKIVTPIEVAHPLLMKKIVKCGKLWVSKNTLIRYNKADVINCDDLKYDLSTTDWYRKIEQPLAGIILKAEQRGIQLDIPHLENLKNEFTQKINEYKEKLCSMAKMSDFNPGSWQQVNRYYNGNGINLESTDKHALKILAWKGDEFARELLRFRAYSKLLGTYVEPFLSGNIQGRLHGRFNQAGRESESQGDVKGTATGRLSSSDPNLQNIPDRTEAGKSVRRAIIASSGLVLIDSDLRQIEPRLVAHYTQSRKLLNAFSNGLDTHALMGAGIFNKRPEELTKLERFIGKTSWLASFYGAWYTKLKLIVEVNTDEPVYFDESYYQKIQEAFWNDNPDLRRWREIHLAETKARGFITTIGGRIIRIDGLNSHIPAKRNEAERMAVNYLIQGSAADIMKIISVSIGRYSDIHSLAWVHDEILAESANKQAKDVISNVMSNTIKLKNVAIEADTRIITNWGEK